MQTINSLVVFNRDKCKFYDAERVCTALKSIGCSCSVEYPINHISLGNDKDLVVVMGGDGTILDTVRRLELQCPIIGINFGKLGYLAYFDLDEFLYDCAAIVAPVFNPTKNQQFFSDRVLLSVHIKSGRDVQHYVAVNDLVIDIGPPFRTATINIEINGTSLPAFRGDGVIVATPTGSTAYNLSASGPIVEPEAECMVVTPKNPHCLSIRPLVLHNHASLRINAIGEGIYAIIDGQEAIAIHDSTFVQIEFYSQKMQLLNHPKMNTWTRISGKLKWGI